jgi:O-antigen/teichoic acid export membrane protein
LKRLGRLLGSRQDSRDTLGSLAAGVGGQLAIVVSGIVAARLLGPADRGHLAFLVLVPVILAKLGGLGLSLAVVYECARSPAVARPLSGRIARRFAAQSGVLLLIHGALLAIVLHDEDRSVVVSGIVTLALVPASLGHEYAIAFLQGLRRFGPFNILRMLPVALYTAAVLAFLVSGASDLVAFVVAWTAAWCASAALAARAVGATLARERGAEAPPPSMRAMTRFGAKGFLGSASPVETFRLDQALIGLFLPPVALGYYVAAIAFTNLPRFLAQSVGLVASPAVAAAPDRREGRHMMWRYLWLAVLLCTPVVLLLEATVGWLLPFLFGGAFEDAIPMARILLVGALFLSLRRVLTDGARGLGRPAIGTIAEVASWVVLLPAVTVAAVAGDATDMAVAVTASAFVSLVVMVAGLTTRRSIAEDGAAGWLGTSRKERVV